MTSKSCTKCPTGKYKNRTGYDECMDCGPGYTTLAKGSVNETQCILGTMNRPVLIFLLLTEKEKKSFHFQIFHLTPSHFTLSKNAKLKFLYELYLDVTKKAYLCTSKNLLSNLFSLLQSFWS